MAGRKAVALIVTSHGRLGDTGRETGYWLEELAVPYFVLRDAGVDVVVASPRGGPAPVDPRSVERARQAAEAGGAAWFGRWQADDAARAASAETAQTSDLHEDRFDAAFVAGGHGAMWDLPGDAALGSFLGGMVTGGKLVGTVCHGAAAWCGLTDAGGSPVVRDRKITCYSDEEERGLGLADVVPFMLETRLRELGAAVVVGPPRESFTMEDARVVTGQNPASSGPTAALFAAALEGD